MYRTVDEIPEVNQPTTVFYGLDYNEEVPEGYFAESVNMTNEDFPVLRQRRPCVKTQDGGTTGQGALAKKSLAVIRDNYLYWAFGATPVNPTAFSNGDKQLVSMGAYLIVFPDGFTSTPSSRVTRGTSRDDSTRGQRLQPSRCASRTEPHTRHPR